MILCVWSVAWIVADGFTGLVTYESGVDSTEDDGEVDVEGKKVSVNVTGERSDLRTTKSARHVQTCLVDKVDQNQLVFEAACFRELPTHLELEF